MPLVWKADANPYVHTAFAVLGLGPNATPPQVVHKAEDLGKKLAGGKAVDVAGVPLDEHAVAEAAKTLKDKETLAEELLLAHPHTAAESKKLKDTIKKLAAAALAAAPPPALPLRHPLAAFALLPPPAPEAVERPTWADFGLPDVGHPDDLALDIVFDC